MYEKIIVSNKKVLINKYGSEGFSAISKALKELVASDEKRGIETEVIYLDSVDDMKRSNGKAVENSMDPFENKEAIDAIFKFHDPHYLMILGSPDVVPHQDLDNPVYNPYDDDIKAWGDLPYACDVPYSRDPAEFIGPTRVVGRLPDLFSSTDPSYLISLLKTATDYESRSQDDYFDYLGLSADVWQGSTRLSLRNIFGNSDQLLLAPPSGPDYPDGQLRNRMHFINCHGGPASPEFYGEQAGNYPVSMSTESINGEIQEGTVVTAECCYGAELYDSVTLAIDMPICQSYLKQGGYGYFGSTTIAYGPSDGNGAADLICQYFLIHVLNGASIGRAVLMARQQYIESVGQMDAIDLKTLAQFFLIGDPSVTPVQEPTATELPVEVVTADAKRFFRNERRQKMKFKGAYLAGTKPTASKHVPIGKVTPTTKRALGNIAKLAGLPETQEFTAFAVKGTKLPKKQDIKIASTPSRYLIAIGIPEGEKVEKIKHGVAVVAKELLGRIVGYRIYNQK